MQRHLDEERRESLKLYYDYFKHFTTLAAALGVIIVALGDLIQGIGPAAFGLASLSLVLFSGITGMVIVVAILEDPSWEDPFGSWIGKIMVFTAIMLIAAVLNFTSNVLPAGSTVIWATIFLILGLVVAMFGVFRLFKWLLKVLRNS